MHKDLGVYDSIKNAMDKDSYNKLVEDINIPKNFIENPVESFKKLNASISDTAFKKFIDNNKFLHDCVKYTTIRTEALMSDGVNIAKSPFEIANLNENADSKLADVIGVNIDRAFGTNGRDDEEAYNKALNNKVQDLSDAQNKTWNAIKNIPRGIWEDIKTTADINKIKDFILNPDMSLDDAAKWSQSAINTVGLIGGARAFVKGRFPVTEKVEVINECSIPPEIEEVNTGGDGVGKAGKSYLSPEMEQKILEGYRFPGKNKIKGGHSPNVIKNDSNYYAVEVISENPDGTKYIGYYRQFSDGKISTYKKSTIFPESWSDEKIINSVKEISNTKPVGSRTGEDGITTALHSGVIDGVKIDVIKEGNVIT